MNSVSTFLTILFLQETKWKAQHVVKRAILPKKAFREKLNTVIEDEFSKVALKNTIKDTSVFDKAKNCCSIFSYKKVCLFVHMVVVGLVF